MDKDKVVAIKEVEGGAPEPIGKAAGDAKLRTDGEADKSVDKIQKYASGLNDAVRDAEAMKSAGLLVASPIRRDAGP